MSEPINNLVPTGSQTSPNLEEIVKKPRTAKPRMNKIVEKAVLLKQISDSKIICPMEVPSSGTIISCPSVSEDIIEEIFTPKPDKTKAVKKVTTESGRSKQASGESSTKILPVDGSDTISITSYKCDLCGIVFTSKVLYDRHPRTIRHKTNLIKKFEAVSGKQAST